MQQRLRDFEPQSLNIQENSQFTLISSHFTVFSSGSVDGKYLKQLVCFKLALKRCKRRGMVLYIVGLGLGDEKDITLRGLECVKSCKILYLEYYTSVLGVDHKLLEKFYGVPVVLADRFMVTKPSLFLFLLFFLLSSFFFLFCLRTILCCMHLCTSILSLICLLVEESFGYCHSLGTIACQSFCIHSTANEGHICISSCDFPIAMVLDTLLAIL